MFETTDWLKTPQGQRAQRWKRARSQVLSRASLEPRSKNGIRKEEREAFQQALHTALGKRRGFRSSVALELDLHGTADNPPEIHTVAKNYIDLTYRAPVGQGRLLRDDRQIQYLAVRYSLKLTSEPWLFLRADRISSFREDILLARAIRHGRLERLRSDDDTGLDMLSQLDEWEANRASTVAGYGAVLFEMHRRMLLEKLQRQELAATQRLLHSLLLDLTSDALVSPGHEIELGGVRLQPANLLEIQKQFLFSPSVSLGLAPLPQQSGQGIVFINAIDTALQQLRSSTPRLFPLVTPLAVVVLLVPPLNSGIDLDNLARKIIPRVHAILEPPARRALPDAETVTDPRLRSFLQQQAAVARRLPKHQVTRYEVVTLPRTPSDPSAGSVRLVLCDGTSSVTFAEHVRDAIEKWEDEDPE